MTPDEHYLAAEELLVEAFKQDIAAHQSIVLAQAQVHATLATATAAYDRHAYRQRYTPIDKYGGHTYQEGGIINAG